MSRIVFTSSYSESILQGIIKPASVFTIRIIEDDFTLTCEQNAFEHYHFYIEYSEYVSRCINKQVKYKNGTIALLETEPITDEDYIIPISSDIDECPVCYETYEPMYGSLCGHHICLECMKKMDKSKLVNCPICRSDKFKFPIALACNRYFT